MWKVNILSNELKALDFFLQFEDSFKINTKINKKSVTKLCYKCQKSQKVASFQTFQGNFKYIYDLLNWK